MLDDVHTLHRVGWCDRLYIIELSGAIVPFGGRFLGWSRETSLRTAGLWRAGHGLSDASQEMVVADHGLMASTDADCDRGGYRVSDEYCLL